MDLSVLEHELASLAPDQQDRLSAFLTSLRMRRDGNDSVISERLNDTDEASWVSWEDVKADLASEPSDAES